MTSHRGKKATYQKVSDFFGIQVPKRLKFSKAELKLIANEAGWIRPLQFISNWWLLPRFGSYRLFFLMV